MYMRIRKAREDAGYTRETFAELLDVSVSYMAEVERGRTGISVKMLIKICKVLGLSADYVLFGETRTDDELRVDRIRRIDERYLPLLDGVITELLALHKKTGLSQFVIDLFSLSKNYPNAPVSAIIEETGVSLWRTGEKMHGMSQSS